MEMATNQVNCRVDGSRKTSPRASRNRTLGVMSMAASGCGWPIWEGRFSRPSRVTAVMRLASRVTPVATATRRSGEKGSSNLPATPAVIAKPAIIIIQTSVAAPARRWAEVRLARRVRTDVPQALTPTPMSRNPRVTTIKPVPCALAIAAVPQAASQPPRLSSSMPPRIQGEHQPDVSAPKPMRGRSSCTR